MLVTRISELFLVAALVIYTHGVTARQREYFISADVVVRLMFSFSMSYLYLNYRMFVEFLFHLLSKLATVLIPFFYLLGLELYPCINAQYKYIAVDQYKWNTCSNGKRCCKSEKSMVGDIYTYVYMFST